MSNELVLLPKRKYEDLIQQKGEGESAPALENERLINISPPSGETNGGEDLDSRVTEKYTNQKMDKPTTYITMKPTTFANETHIHNNKKWMKFKM